MTAGASKAPGSSSSRAPAFRMMSSRDAPLQEDAHLVLENAQREESHIPVHHRIGRVDDPGHHEVDDLVDVTQHPRLIALVDDGREPHRVPDTNPQILCTPDAEQDLEDPVRGKVPPLGLLNGGGIQEHLFLRGRLHAGEHEGQLLFAAEERTDKGCARRNAVPRVLERLPDGPIAPEALVKGQFVLVVPIGPGVYLRRSHFIVDEVPPRLRVDPRDEAVHVEIGDDSQCNRGDRDRGLYPVP